MCHQFFDSFTPAGSRRALGCLDPIALVAVKSLGGEVSPREGSSAEIFSEGPLAGKAVLSEPTVEDLTGPSGNGRNSLLFVGVKPKPSHLCPELYISLALKFLPRLE